MSQNISSKVMMLIVEVVVILLEVMRVVKSMPEGVPVRACETMNPGHCIQPRNTSCPYTFAFDRTEIRSNESVVFKIRTRGETFKGFMVQARNEQDKPIGRFQICGYNIRLLSCSGGKGNTATHAAANVTRITNMKWRPPENYTGVVTFYATVVKELLKFWVKQQVSPVVRVYSTSVMNFSEVIEDFSDAPILTTVHCNESDTTLKKENIMTNISSNIGIRIR